tara:strand:- start:2558 stop:2830 length:273 start_codon:yes stop_codon:yes gene_type:complete
MHSVWYIDCATLAHYRHWMTINSMKSRSSTLWREDYGKNILAYSRLLISTITNEGGDQIFDVANGTPLRVACRKLIYAAPQLGAVGIHPS